MIQTSGALPLLILLIGPIFLPTTLFASAHGYLSSPRSRNFRATEAEDGMWWGGPGDGPYPEDCPHCLNRKPAEGTCGGSYDIPRDMLDRPMEWASQATYTAGDTVVVDATLTAHHRGHMEMYACDVSDGTTATTACFESNPLIFVQDLMYDGPDPDPVYPERAYVAPNNGEAGDPGDWGPSDGMQFSFEYRLPTGVSGSKVLLQWRYYTANTCEAPGYDSNKPEWQENSRVPCGPMDETGDSAPERFWNCAEVTIGAGGPTVSPAPSDPPVVQDSIAPSVSKSPTQTPLTSEPTLTAPPTNVVEGGTCGGGMPGNGICSDPALCCSEWWHCGSTPAYCGPEPDFSNAPSSMPSQSQSCVEEPDAQYVKLKSNGQVKLKKCKSLAKLMIRKPDRATKICQENQVFHTKDNGTLFSPPENTCQVTCSSCDACYENPKARFFKKVNQAGKVKTKKCKQLKPQNLEQYCTSTSFEGGYPPARDQCPESCSAIIGNSC